VKTVKLSQITDLQNLEQRAFLDNISDEKISNYSSDPGHMQCFWIILNPYSWHKVSFCHSVWMWKLDKHDRRYL